MKTWKLIDAECEYIEAIINVVNTSHAIAGSIEFEERELLMALIRDYEDRKL